MASIGTALDFVTAGTASASLPVVLDANTAVSGLKMPLGTASTSQSLPVLTANVQNTAVTSGTTQNTEYVLQTFDLPANALSAVGKSVRITAYGTLAANANAKTLKLYFGSQVISTATGMTGSGDSFEFTGVVTKTGSNTQNFVGKLLSGTAVVNITASTATQTDTSAITIKFSSINTAAAAASATGLAMIVEYLA